MPTCDGPTSPRYFRPRKLSSPTAGRWEAWCGAVGIFGATVSRGTLFWQSLQADLWPCLGFGVTLALSSLHRAGSNDLFQSIRAADR